MRESKVFEIRVGFSLIKVKAINVLFKNFRGRGDGFKHGLIMSF
jgi:hypothetical protein